MWVVFSFTGWGDLLAGLVLVPLLMAVLRFLDRLRTGVAGSVGQAVRQGTWIGFLAICVVHLRSSAAPVALGVCGVAGLAALVVARGRPRALGVLATSAAAGAFLLGLLPWSWAASSTLHDRVLTTTSVPVVRAVTFGDRSELCFGPCDPRASRWFGPSRYSREVSRATGLSETEVQRQMSAYARQDVTARSYVHAVRLGFRRYLDEPGRFIRFLHPPSVRNDEPTPMFRFVHTGTAWVFDAAVLLTALTCLLVVRRDPRAQALNLLLKVAVGALLVQPFVHISGGRYWTTAAPLAGLAAVVVWQAVVGHRPTPAPTPAPAASARLALLLTVLQALASLAFVAVAATLVLHA